MGSSAGSSKNWIERTEYLMKRILSVVILVVACATADSQWEWFIPVGDTIVTQQKNPTKRVAFLDEEPQDRPFEVIGIIAPPEGSFESYTEGVEKIRAVAAMYGADAVFVTSDREGTGREWRFGQGVVDAKRVAMKAKAIVWK